MEMCALDFDLCLSALEKEMLLNGWSIVPDYANLFVREWPCGDIEIAVGPADVVEYYPHDDNCLSVDYDFIYSLDAIDDSVTIEGLDTVLAKYGLPSIHVLKKLCQLERNQRLGISVVQREYFELISGLKVKFDI